MKRIIPILLCGFLLSSFPKKKVDYALKEISGIYPHLAYYNNEGECGTGAVVPWANKLWVITYGPHLPKGSSDKLYEINSNLELKSRSESIGGTPANRMIHKESNQLFIGPYAINQNGDVNPISYSEMPGRPTGNARHLTDPENKIYYGTMEEGFYEVDVSTLDVNTLYTDGNGGQGTANIPGAHGKGLYSGQGVLVYSNNGENSGEARKRFDIESGALAEWDGKDWTVVRRNQFVEVTGPGGILGSENPATDPIWTSGFDHKSLIVGVRDPQEGWSFYRLPKASNTYDGAHGWNTEWPRIRNVGTPDNPDFLMTMHGMFWKFPETFTKANSSGIRPRSAYLKVIGDFARWNDQIVFGCDDSAKREFLNKRKAKGQIEGPGQSNSNLWFADFDKPDNLGPTTATGAVWLNENIKVNEISEPFLFTGWDERIAWIKNSGNEAVNFTFEIDRKGDNNWEELTSRTVGGGEAANIIFKNNQIGEWVRVSVDKATRATVEFNYSQKESRSTNPDDKFKGLASIDKEEAIAGLLWGLGDNRRALGVLAGNVDNNVFSETGYYELDAQMNLVKKEDQKTAQLIRDKVAIPKQVITIDEASVLIVDDSGRRWRLPKGNTNYKTPTDSGLLRICREVATERDLFNSSGTFYELPAENADGYAKIRPIASHEFRIFDYASYRGLLVMTGINPQIQKGNVHIIKSSDGKAAVWAGAIDDLWELGKPVGSGGPWKNSLVQAGKASDPYLIGFYDKRNLTLSHNSDSPVEFEIEVQPLGHGPWMLYKKVVVEKGEEYTFTFPDEFEARWVRFKTNADCRATAWLVYE